MLLGSNFHLKKPYGSQVSVSMISPPGACHFQKSVPTKSYDNRVLQTTVCDGAWGLPVAVVGELIVTGECNQHPKADAQGETHLRGSVYPHLQRGVGE